MWYFPWDGGGLGGEKFLHILEKIWKGGKSQKGKKRDNYSLAAKDFEKRIRGEKWRK